MTSGRFRTKTAVGLLVPLLTVACGDSPTADAAGDEAPPAELSCTIDTDLIYVGGGGKDAIPALSDPPFVAAGDHGAAYLRDRFRVVGLRVGETYLAVPHNILWWHEIVNLDVDDLQLAVTYCPLTGSALVFDRGSVAGAELGVSGLLFLNNLILYDRREPSSLFPQMMRQASCGPNTGLRLVTYPAVEMTWETWRTLHPDTRVVSGATGYARDYTRYPYGSYEDLADTTTLYPMPSLDTSRPPKERVLGIPDGAGGGIAFPFQELSDPDRPRRVIQRTVAGTPLVVLWDEPAQAAAAFLPALGGQAIELTVEGGRFVDGGTGSVWTVDGLAVGGSLRGERLTPVQPAYVAFWFAWSAFQPHTEVWLDVS